MKRFLISISSAALLAACLLQGCDTDRARRSPLENAEIDFANGHYAGAQQLCDSLILGSGFNKLNVNELCRLSLLFMRLAENHGDEEANTALAARSLEAAMTRNADSTIMYLGQAPVEDQARLALITAINEGHKAPAVTDTIAYDY